MVTKKVNYEKTLNKELISYFQESQEFVLRYGAFNKITFQDFLANKMLIIDAIRIGIPFSIFNIIKQYAPFTETDWANFLDLSTKSLQRYKQESKFYFKSLHSEKIIAIAEVTEAGINVFGDMNKFKLWLNTPNFALGKFKPIELLKDAYGKELVMLELTNINHGIFA